jgi:hypothetical protein
MWRKERRKEGQKRKEGRDVKNLGMEGYFEVRSAPRFACLLMLFRKERREEGKKGRKEGRKERRLAACWL